MKKRIEQLLNGIFEYEPMKLVMEPAEISVSASPGAAVRGSFRISAADGRKVRGFLYTSNPRVLCDPVEFQGSENVIQYQIDCSGFEEGAQEKGVVTVCTDLGEYTLPYEITVTSGQPDTGRAAAENSAQLADLARQDFQRAHRVFLSQEFRDRLAEKEPEAAALCDCLRLQPENMMQLEEFLAGMGCKDPVEISAEQDSYSWDGLSGPVREAIRLTKNTWGYQEIAVASDARFLRPERKTITTEDFAGSSYDLYLVLDTNLMHAGKNYARLSLTAGGRTIEIEVTARRAGQAQAGRGSHIRKIMMKELESLYVRFRLKKIDLTTWVERSVSVINSYRRAGGTDPYADLFLVQLYFADGKKQRAYKLLEALEGQRRRLDTPERYGFYLYMSTFFYQEASYVDRVEEEIGRMFSRDRTNWKLLWILLYLREEYLDNDSAKYEAIAEQFRAGCRSRIMYLEAWQILKKDPFLMRHIGAYELQLLRFAKEEGVLTAELLRQTANLAQHQPVFDRRLYEVLVSGYQMYPSQDLLKTICLLLIKGDCRDNAYFPWYEKGVESGLRITGLYEYYMESMAEPDLQAMPQVIRMYFAYDNSLDYRKRAAIYRRIVENRENDGQTFRNYRSAMEKFTLDQLEAGRISDDLAVLYQMFLKRAALTKSAAEKLARILFTCEVTCDLPGMRQVVVHSALQKSEQTALFADGRALVPVYDPNSAVVVEDAQGRRYLASGFCQIRKLLENEEMLSWCAQKASDFPGMLLYICVQCAQAGPVQPETLPYFRAACESRVFSNAYRDELRREVMEYYVNHLRDDSLPDFLEGIPYLEYVKVDKAALITLLAEEGKCSDAFALLDAYGTEGIALLQLVRICSRMVLELEFEENSLLVSMCHSCFANDKYDDKLLRYLLLYYEGPVSEMEELWRAAVRFDLDTMILEEKIIMMLLFTQSGTQGSEPVFESYWKKMGRKRLCRAYVNLRAYEYFVKGIPVADPVFRYIEREYRHLMRRERLEEQEEVCRLALLQYYSRSAQLKPEQRKLVEEMLEEFAAKGMRFDFWRRFDEELLAPYQMEGRVFAEYACNPASRVNIFYRMRGSGEEYRCEAMKNYFEGIFVREFTLFDGDELECYLEEELDGSVRKTDLWVLHAPSGPQKRVSKYEVLNRISRAQKSGDVKTQNEELENCLMLEYLAGELFTLI